ncbi:hypothetical protein ITJ64_12565 [Herbiconiux sp. VKM Ac-1786]|jgi:hypothetical protein|uniref:hypothetical protein n=1 Tax=Herbiconiux sp. VKM Ac-1786 TaxID=2783824 RepID=UPI00188A1C02|nr:hypothetical protein [Herbiconiux sp. VKM Ac-1786]MBF4573351.1 hypothetical protein [Herbiconiux sp. VKM Ac-1786]
MSLSHDGQPLTRRQLREMERQGQAPLPEEGDDGAPTDAAEGAAEADAAATNAPVSAGGSRRVVREQGPADTVQNTDTHDSDTVQNADTVHEGVDEDTIVPEVVSPDEAVDDAEPAGSPQPIIEVVPISDPVLVQSPPDEAQPDDTAEHAEIVPNSDTDDSDDDTVVEEMVIDEPAPVSAGTPTPGAGDEPNLAPVFQSPNDRVHPSSDELPSSFDDLISLRNTAATNSISTTSALVLPTVPGSGDVGTALDETGEVIITGSIDLPKSFGSLGAPASGLESNDLDTLLERSEAEQSGSDVAPVSASRAISTNTSSTSLIAPPKRARANAPVVLAITAGVLAVGVVGLLLAVFVFQVF